MYLLDDHKCCCFTKGFVKIFTLVGQYCNLRFSIYFCVSCLLVSNSYLLAYCKDKYSTRQGVRVWPRSIVNVEMSSLCKVLCFTRTQCSAVPPGPHYRTMSTSGQAILTGSRSLEWPCKSRHTSAKPGSNMENIWKPKFYIIRVYKL